MFSHSRGHIQIKVTEREPIIARRLLVLERALQRGAHYARMTASVASRLSVSRMSHVNMFC